MLIPFDVVRSRADAGLDERSAAATCCVTKGTLLHTALEAGSGHAQQQQSHPTMCSAPSFAEAAVLGYGAEDEHGVEGGAAVELAALAAAQVLSHLLSALVLVVLVGRAPPPPVSPPELPPPPPPPTPPRRLSPPPMPAPESPKAPVVDASHDIVEDLGAPVIVISDSDDE